MKLLCQAFGHRTEMQIREKGDTRHVVPFFGFKIVSAWGRML